MTKRYILVPEDTCGKIPTRMVNTNTDPVCEEEADLDEEFDLTEESLGWNMEVINPELDEKTDVDTVEDTVEF